MATISANGGAERYWRHGPTGTRAVLCRNGKLLINRGGASHWKISQQFTRAAIEGDARWQPLTTSAASGAVTRTTRLASYRESAQRRRRLENQTK